MGRPCFDLNFMILSFVCLVLVNSEKFRSDSLKFYMHRKERTT